MFTKKAIAVLLLVKLAWAGNVRPATRSPQGYFTHHRGHAPIWDIPYFPSLDSSSSSDSDQEDSSSYEVTPDVGHLVRNPKFKPDPSAQIFKHTISVDKKRSSLTNEREGYVSGYHLKGFFSSYQMSGFTVSYERKDFSLLHGNGGVKAANQGHVINSNVKRTEFADQLFKEQHRYTDQFYRNPILFTSQFF